MTSTTQTVAARPTQPTPDIMIQKMSVLAQAKPAIINSSNQYSNGLYDSPEPRELSELSDNLNAALKLSRSSKSEAQLRTQADFLLKRSESLSSSRHRHQHQQRLRTMHIDDSTTIDKQNATNQMRQAAAVMSAIAASQQSKQRLSATERLAMTARRPQMQAQQQPEAAQGPSVGTILKQNTLAQVPAVPTHQHHARSISQPVRPQAPVGAKPPPLAAMPTLETLLAVQRQLQRHTRQNLNSTKSPNQPQDLVNKQQQNEQNEQQKQEAVTTTTTSSKANEQEQYFSKQYPNLTSRLQPNIACEQNNYVTTSGLQHDNYDKELPPLPASISPSSCTTNTTDESQMNSLESQSSPATSLISLPPPPPPLSSYLQQYDEVASSHQHQLTKQPNGSLQSNTSTPQTSRSPSSAASYEISPLRHSPVVPIKQQVATTSAAQSTRQRPPPLAPRPQHLNLNQPQPASRHDRVVIPSPLVHELPSSFTTKNQSQASPFPLPPVLPERPMPTGVDEADCASFRFPTPPPPDMLLDDIDDEDLEMMLMKKSVEFGGGQEDGRDDDDEEDDFQCRIPTPPSGTGQKSMSFVSFPDLNNCHDLANSMQHQQRLSHFFASAATTNQQQQQQYRALFNSSSFSVPQQEQQQHQPNASQPAAMSGDQQIMANAKFTMPPPPLFRQAQPNKRPVESQQQVKKSASSDKIAAPQLTVRVNEREEAASAARLASTNSSGLLSTAGRDQQHHQQHANMHQQHHEFMMNTMVRSAVASSSSPSSSSDGDGHSSNSSSSTSGVHSSIDSPSLKSESDFNYVGPAVVAAPIKSQLMHATADMQKPALPSKHQHRFLPPRQYQQQQQHQQNKLPRPALKQKKSVSFSDRIELVACAEEQCEQHLPNPLLARVLAATKSQ